MKKRIYLDNNATTKPDETVVEAMMPYLTSSYGNPSSIHHLGVEADKAIIKNRRLLADLLNCEENEVYFTSGATEANNLLLNEIAGKGDRTGHIVTTAVEHSSVRDVLTHLENLGHSISWIRPDKHGLIKADKIVEAVSEDTILVSMMHVNNETGSIFPVENAAKKIKADFDHPPIIHVDGVQAFGKYPIDLSFIDIYSVSGHKIHAPKGIGAFYLNNQVNIAPLLRGGEQEHGIRSGTENVPGIVGICKATELMYEKQEEKLKKMKDLRSALVDVIDEIPDAQINTSLDHSLPTTLNVSFPPVPGEIIVNGLSEEGIYVSSGSACAGRKGNDSHVLEAMGLDKKYIQSSVRFSFSRMTTGKEIEQVGETLKQVLPRLKKVAQLKY